MDVIIRPIEQKELLFMEEMFYQSLFVPEGEAPFPRSILDEPHLSKYLSYWGSRPQDISLVAEVEGHLVGAVWSRLFKEEEGAYGFVDENTPEIGIALEQAFRAKGIGTQLMRHIEAANRAIGTQQLSLSVDKRNKAIHLYEKLGYKIIKEEDTAYTMMKKLDKYLTQLK